MKLALAMETSGPIGSVALLSSDAGGLPRVMAEETLHDGMKQGVDLFPAIARVLSAAGVEARDVDLVAVGTGPGSYTGLRVGVTAARALAYAIGAELLGVPSCDAWARGAQDEDRPVAVVTDARVRAVYISVYRRGGAEGAEWDRTFGPEIVEPPAAGDQIPDGAILLGDAARAYPEFLGRFPHREDPARASAADVGRMALGRHLGGERSRIDTVRPLYLRKSEAERRWEQRNG